jgi:NAD(P)-dependent dehydrogenase (short-subunit alcohol dehydrogenase family)
VLLLVDPFLPKADFEQEFSTKELDVNLKGTLFIARIGFSYLGKNKKNGRGKGSNLVLVNSIARKKEYMGLVAYKVIGIIRGLHLNAV